MATPFTERRTATVRVPDPVRNHYTEQEHGMTTPVLIHQALTVVAAMFGGMAWFAFDDGNLRVGLQLVVLVVVAFGAMLANKQHADGGRTAEA